MLKPVDKPKGVSPLRSEPCVRFSRTRFSSQWFPHRDWLADSRALAIVKSPRVAKCDVAIVCDQRNRVLAPVVSTACAGSPGVVGERSQNEVMRLVATQGGFLARKGDSKHGVKTICQGFAPSMPQLLCSRYVGNGCV